MGQTFDLPSAEKIPRCEALDGSSLRIVPAYTEAGRLCEANAVTITDGERACVYVPFAAVKDEKPAGPAVIAGLPR